MTGAAGKLRGTHLLRGPEMEKLKKDYAVLGVDPGAPFDEIEAAYREKISLWQANLEKQAGKPHLLKESEEQMQAVTEAFNRICNYFRDHGKPDFSVPATAAEASEESPAGEGTEAGVEMEEEGPEESISDHLPEVMEQRVFLLKVLFFGALFVIVVFAGIIFAVVMVRLTGSRGKAPQLQSGITYQRYSSHPGFPPVLRPMSARPKIEPPPRHPAVQTVRKKRSAVMHRKEAPVPHFAHGGSVLFVKSAGEFTYVEVSEAGRNVWVALPRTDRVAVGDSLEFPGTPSLLNYYCPVLSRSVERMIFPSAYVVNGRKYGAQ